VNLLEDNIDTIKKKKNTETLIWCQKEFGLVVHAEKTKYIYVAVSLLECRVKSLHKDSKQRLRSD
jgi:hypothetical protein